MAASKLYRNSSFFQCLSNLFLNVFTFGAVTVLSGNSFHTFTILMGKHSFLIFKCALSWNNFKQCPSSLLLVYGPPVILPDLRIHHNISHVIFCTSQSCLHVFVCIQGLAALRLLVFLDMQNLSYMEAALWPFSLYPFNSNDMFFLYGDHIIHDAYSRCDLSFVRRRTICHVQCCERSSDHRH